MTVRDAQDFVMWSLRHHRFRFSAARLTTKNAGEPSPFIDDQEEDQNGSAAGSITGM